MNYLFIMLCYLCCIVIVQEISDRVFTREELGLPATGFIYVCFNRLDKVESSIWLAWMTILSRVPDSVLWLAASHPTAVANLQRTAATYGITADRLIWSTKTPLKSDHYARHRVADLFLDTRYYNAHTTATDALYAGLPVLTLPGETLASRVAASLITAAFGDDLSPHLIATSIDDYINKAVHYATAPAHDEHLSHVSLSVLRHRLVDQRASYPLFNTPRYVHDMEDLYVTVWNDWSNNTNNKNRTIATTVTSAASTTSIPIRSEL
jgi:protein O-GlcNAc transferase